MKSAPILRQEAEEMARPDLLVECPKCHAWPMAAGGRSIAATARCFSDALVADIEKYSI